MQHADICCWQHQQSPASASSCCFTVLRLQDSKLFPHHHCIIIPAEEKDADCSAAASRSAQQAHEHCKQGNTCAAPRTAPNHAECHSLEVPCTSPKCCCPYTADMLMHCNEPRPTLQLLLHLSEVCTASPPVRVLPKRPELVCRILPEVEGRAT